ncbi:MAG: PilN domain-containing protein [Phycisphaerales bacterium]|nr:PilN domain-containing protein [Phycisphaerales bacterium]
MTNNYSPNQLSFLPDDYLQRKVRRRSNIICGTILAIFAVTFGGVMSYYKQSSHHLTQREAKANEDYTQVTQRIKLVQEMQAKQQRMAHQAELTASLLEKVPRSYLLAELTNSLPIGVSLLDLSLNSTLRQPAAALTKFEQKKKEIKSKPVEAQPKVFDVRIKLTGIAYTDVQVAQYIGKLSTCQLFQQVGLTVVEEYTLDGKKLRKFQLDMQLNPDIGNSAQSLSTSGSATTAVPVD